MSKPRDPRRLELEGSPGVKQVIEALRSDAPSSVTMQRMVQKLEPVLDAPAPASSASDGLVAGPLGKIALVVLAVGALFAFLPRSFPRSGADEHAPVIEATRTVSSGLRAPEVAAPAPLAPTQLPSVQAVASSNAPSAEAPPPTSAEPAPYALRKRAGRSPAAATLTSTRVPKHPGIAPATDDRRAEATAASERASMGPAPSGPPAAATEADATTATPRAAEPPAAEALPASGLAAAPAQDSARQAASAPTVALDEAAMLQRARRLARDQPAAALRLLDEHKRRFAQGMLAPEREVMAIEILRAQSRSSEAALRLSAFRQHYPDSVYLQRLDHPAPRP